MELSKLIELYKKEREYETRIFGDYAKVEPLNFASFLIFLKQYADKALVAYTEKWDTTLPPWLINSKEFQQDGSAPVKAYEEVIKIMALAGAALETYAEIDPEKWREDIEMCLSKWRD